MQMSVKNKIGYMALGLVLLLTTAVWALPAFSDTTVTANTSTGRIAYAGLDANGRAVSIRAINPDGSQPETLYTLQDVGEISDVAWHPHGREISFLASDEAAFSPFFQDIFAINILNKQVRRVSSPPRFAGLPSPYATGKVRGTLRNGAGANNISIISLYVQGATGGVQIPTFNMLDEVAFEVDVADLGPGVEQYIFISWSHTSGGPYKEIVPTPVDVQAGQTVDVGLVNFVGNTAQPKLSDLSWNGDGSLAGVLLENGGTAPWGFARAGETFGASLGDVGLISTVALSPVGNQMAYYKVVGGEGAIALNNVGGTAATEEIILNDPTSSLNFDRHIAWLPDGSGLVIAVNGQVADGEDLSWLWDVKFEDLSSLKVKAAGERGTDLAVRLTYASVEHELIKDPVKAIKACPPGRVEVLANYTAFRDLKKALAHEVNAAKTANAEATETTGAAANDKNSEEQNS
ncbi:MAG: DUF1727 domain-containing protein [Anaerolineales bacterium]|nr:DUF1727 domain-containing protein [Anaerolineales bacterium]